MQKIENKFLVVEIEELGAQLKSIKDKSGTEYLWQGDERYWKDRAINIFPFVARLTEGKYTLGGKTYEMNIHGFARNMNYTVDRVSESEVSFTITETAETLKAYPYKFEFTINYKLVDNKLINTYIVKNNDTKQMYFGVGGHPGFNVPFEKETEFEDYYLEFEGDGENLRVNFSEDCYVLDGFTPFTLDNGNKLNLKHNLFDDDAIVLKNAAKSVMLKSDKVDRAVRVTYEGMDYLGIWHKPKTDAPYVCIEPWSSLPSRKGIIEEFETKPDLVSIGVGDTYKNGFAVEIVKL
ncbi:MAG: aldose 1-epimerase family protein [Clostridia bacterium]|nr:aldose 1-epimerase family protein [Clostridia bacterium]